MTIREAKATDVEQIQVVRNSVKENVLSDPDLVTNEDCIEHITQRGKGWVCEVNNRVVGFSIVDLNERNVWALFLHPDFESKGIGRKLHDIMLQWYFEHTSETLWLGTDPGTRAEQFYVKAGWHKVGVRENGEVKFEMTHDSWVKQHS